MRGLACPVLALALCPSPTTNAECCDVLGHPQTPDEAKANWRAGLLRLHPDKEPDPAKRPQAEERFKCLQACYDQGFRNKAPQPTLRLTCSPRAHASVSASATVRAERPQTQPAPATKPAPATQPAQTRREATRPAQTREPRREPRREPEAKPEPERRPCTGLWHVQGSATFAPLESLKCAGDKPCVPWVPQDLRAYCPRGGAAMSDVLQVNLQPRGPGRWHAQPSAATRKKYLNDPVPLRCGPNVVSACAEAAPGYGGSCTDFTDGAKRCEPNPDAAGLTNWFGGPPCAAGPAPCLEEAEITFDGRTLSVSNAFTDAYFADLGAHALWSGLSDLERGTLVCSAGSPPSGVATWKLDHPYSDGRGLVCGSCGPDAFLWPCGCGRNEQEIQQHCRQQEMKWNTRQKDRDRERQRRARRT